MSEEIVLKVDLEGDVRRFRVRLPQDAGETERCAVLVDTIRDGFKIAEGSGEFVLKYKDEEEDLCTLVEATLADFLLQGASSAGPLRLIASRPVPMAAPTTAPAVAGGSPPQASASTSLPPPAAATSGLNPEAPAFVVQGVQGGLLPAQESGPPVEVLANAVAQALTGSLPGGAYSGGVAERERGAGFAEGFVPSIASQGCRSIGPQKLLACLAGLQQARLLSSRMISSLVLQFLPILAQRAHRKQEKINRIGAQHREMVLPLLRKALAGANTIADLEHVRPLLEEFVSGADDSKLGDCVAALLKALANAQAREPVAALLRGAGEDLLDLLPKAMPDVLSWDGGQTMGVAEHRGARCANCSAEPILGPRFCSAVAEKSMDLCGECFAFHTFEAGDKFDCHFMPEGIKGFLKGKGKEKVKGNRGKGSRKGRDQESNYWMQTELVQDPGEAYDLTVMPDGVADAQERPVVQGTPVLMLQGKSWKNGKGRHKGKLGKWQNQADAGKWAQENNDMMGPAVADMPNWGYETYWWAPGYYG